MDSLSAIAPARIKALVVPIGHIKHERFQLFVERLNAEQVVHLRDISADGRPNRNMFSPLAFPDGALFYDLTTHAPAQLRFGLSPFDLYREPLALLAIADGAEMHETTTVGSRYPDAKTVCEAKLGLLEQELEKLREAHDKLLVHQVLVFDYRPPRGSDPVRIPDGIVAIPPVNVHKRTTMKTVMCDVSSLVLAEMTTRAKQYEAVSYLDSPSQAWPGKRQGNGIAEEPGVVSRRRSQFAPAATARSASASGSPDRHHARMSMPPMPMKNAQLGAHSSTPPRPSTPASSRAGLDDFAGSPEQNGPRPGAGHGLRSHSQDRVPVLGFGSGGLGERWRKKGRSRVQIVVGSLYLQAGQWPDSIRELLDAATVSKSSNDHLWHGKALELILINLLLLAWADRELTVPAMLFPPAEPPKAAPAAGLEVDERQRQLRLLEAILPALLERVVALYSRIATEHLPPLPLSEAVIRFSKMLTALHVWGGELGRASLDMMVCGTIPAAALTTSPRFSIVPNRPHILGFLLQAYPGPAAPELWTTVDRVVVLGAIASVLGVLGFRRKKALVVRELVTLLVAGLVEARTKGAADVGIHPAAGLVALDGAPGHGALDLGEGGAAYGVEAFLGLLLQTHGVVSHDPQAATATPDALASRADHSDEAIVQRIRTQSAVRFFGSLDIKLSLLRSCISFSEALPDLAGVLRFSSDLLRTAGRGAALGPRPEDAYPAISHDEQVRLATSISKTAGLSKQLGLGPVAAEYWDEFLLRGVQLEPLPPSRRPVPHTKTLLRSAVTAPTPQPLHALIHNPFLKPAETAVADRVLVAGETATFRLTLQNPFAIEVDIESVRLETDGVAFDSAGAGVVLGPCRIQVLPVSGTPKRSGLLRLTGALIRVRGCRPRRFPIFADPWTPENELPIKAIGLGALASRLTPPWPFARPLRPQTLELNVISQQPVVVVKGSTLPQFALMMLQGELQGFGVTLENLSRTTPVDCLVFSFQDSTQPPLQAALGSRGATAVELHEYELELAEKPALRLQRRNGHDASQTFIAPGTTATFALEILGKPGLTSARIQIDYACLASVAEEAMHTRQVSLDLTVTVNPSVDVARFDVVPLCGTMPRPLYMRTHCQRLPRSSLADELAEDQYCLLVLDLRNAWPGNMVVQLETGGEGGARVEQPILPGNTSRLVMPIRRVYLEHPHAPIPALDPSRPRQFVVSTTMPPHEERATREAFWYREKLMQSLRATWRATGRKARTGLVELRAMQLTTRMMDALRMDEVGIEMDVGPRHHSDKPALLYTDEPAELHVRITNRMARPMYPTLRIQPALCHRPPNVALDLTRKMGWNGVLQQPGLPLLAGGGAHLDVHVGLVPLCRGVFEVGVSVEETRLWDPEPQAEDGSDMDVLMDKASAMVLGKRERSIWHAPRARYFVVRDKE